MKFLFWNTYKNESINSVLSELIMENNISIAVLAEYSANMKELIDILISNGIIMKQYYSGCDRIKLLGSLNSVEPRLDTDHASIQIINGKDILCCVHLNCQLYSGHQGRREILIEQIVHDIQTVEQEIDTENSIVVGDFNISPYDPSCIDARYFHGIPVYSEAKRKSRDVERKEYYMFYNPMWNLLGDFKPPYGTYYSNEGGTQNTFWYIFDQVIFKPALRKRFVDESLKIITHTKTKYLLDKNGHPDKNISDHLPIVFEFEEEYCYGSKP
nr:endonuclease/exonuclease/phosphatase [uncultured Acetatifactor sp.]